MKITEDFLTINNWSRPGKKLESILAIVMHWTANPRASAKANRDYFEQRKCGSDGYGSAHYIIDQDGSVIHAIPDDEIAYHCGSNQIDPESKKIYTDYARQIFGTYYTTENRTPNFVSIGVELCPLDKEGHFSAETYNSAIELCKDLIEKFNLTVQDITTHHAVVGWKDCPKLWTDKPELFEKFKQDIEKEMAKPEPVIVKKEEPEPVIIKKEEPKQSSFIGLLIQILRRLLCGKR